MKKMLKRISLSLIAIMMLMVTPGLTATINAENKTIDVSAPTIQNLNLVEKGETLRFGDKLHISLETEDDSNISNVQLNFKHDISGTKKTIIYDGKTEKSGVKNYEFEIPENMSDGKWSFDFIYLKDEFDNSEYYHGFEELNFYVIGNSSDVIAPLIKNLTLIEKGETLRFGDKLHISLETEDDSNISNVQLNFKHDISGTKKTIIYDGKTEKSGLKNYEFEIPENMSDGKWSFDFIYLKDEFDNSEYYHGFEDLNFYVVGNSSDVIAPLIKNITLIEKGETLRFGDILHISLETEDDSNISNVQLNFKHDISGTKKTIIYDGKTEKSGLKNYEIEIPENMSDGKWSFDFIYLKDEFDNSEYYYGFEELNFYVNYKEEETGTTIDVGQSEKIQLNGGSGSWTVDDPSIVSIDNYGFGSGVGGGGSYFGAFVEFTGLKAGSTTLRLRQSSGRVLFSEEITVKHVPLITTEIETEEHTFTGFETKYVEDANLEKGKEKVRVEGVKGYSVTTYTYTYKDGVKVNTETATVIIKPVNKVIAKGTYEEPVITTETEEKEHPYTNFETRYIEDSKLEKGKEEVRVEGQKGYSVTTYTYTYENGLLVNTEKNMVVFEPINEVIARGTYEKTQSGWIKQNEKWMYYDTEGVVQTGWTQVEKTWYHMNSEGHMQTGWTHVNGTWYYTNDSGAMQTGWTQVSGIWYYMSNSGAMQTGWTQVGSIWYYLNNSGAMQTGWTQVGSIWYYMNNSGAMQTGWTQVGSIWYYMNNSGAMQTGWTQVGSIWYYMNNSGAMQTGWTQVGSTWYYMNNSGAMQTGWVKLDNSWYYLNSDGSMQNRNTTINGRLYRFNSSGQML